MKLSQAGAYADRIVYEISHLCDKIQVAGSIRRKKAHVHDIDIVLIPSSPWNWTSIIALLKTKMQMTVVLSGTQLARLSFKEVELSVDLYRATQETWGVILLIRTGSTQHNVVMCSRAQRNGMMLSAKDGVIKEGKVIASRTEEDIFKALNMTFVEPSKREA